MRNAWKNQIKQKYAERVATTSKTMLDSTAFAKKAITGQGSQSMMTPVVNGKKKENNIWKIIFALTETKQNLLANR